MAKIKSKVSKKSKSPSSDWEILPIAQTGNLVNRFKIPDTYERSPIKFQSFGNTDYGFSTGLNNLNFSGGLNLEDLDNPTLRTGIGYRKKGFNINVSPSFSKDQNQINLSANYNKGDWSGNLNYETPSKFGLGLGYDKNGFSGNVNYNREGSKNLFNTQLSYQGEDFPLSGTLAYDYNDGHSASANLGFNKGNFRSGLNYDYSQVEGEEGDKQNIHKFGINVGGDFGKNKRWSFDTSANTDLDKSYKINAGLKYRFQKGGNIPVDPMGYWNPDNYNEPAVRIPSNQITMQGIPYPVLGVSNTGQFQMMYPNQDYQFEGSSVTEYPIMQAGGRTPILGTQQQYQAYQDSLNAYNSSIKRLPLLEKAAYDKYGSDRWIMENDIKNINKTNPKYVPKFQNRGYNPINFNITSNSTAGNTNKESIEYSYTKPVQPVVYKEKDIIKTIQPLPLNLIKTNPINQELDTIPFSNYFSRPRQLQNIGQGKTDYFDKNTGELLGTYEEGGELPEAGSGYKVTRSNERKGKTHKVIGPDGTVKFFGDSKLGQHPKDPARKKAFYARHAKNLKNNPYFRAFARKTWAEGGELNDWEILDTAQDGKLITERKDFKPWWNWASRKAGDVDSRQDAFGTLGDLYAYYAGQPLHYNTLEYSKYKPTNSKDPNATYISINDPKFKQEIFDKYNDVFVKKQLQAGLSTLTVKEDKINDNTYAVSGYSKPTPEQLKEYSLTKKPLYAIKGKGHVSNAIGRYFLSKGKDDKGEYISYYDTFDEGSGPNGGGIGEILKLTKPFEIYGRIYLDPKTGKPVQPEKPINPYIQKAPLPGQSVQTMDFAQGGMLPDLAAMAAGGQFLTVGGEYHRIYRNAEGDIMVNHPKEDKGKWDTINLTDKAGSKTVAEGVAATKKWHRENPYAFGGNVILERYGDGGSTWEILPKAQTGKITLDEFRPKFANSNENIQRDIYKNANAKQKQAIELQPVEITARRTNPLGFAGQSLKSQQTNPANIPASQVASQIFSFIPEALHTPSRAVNYGLGAYKNKDLAFNPYQSEISETLGWQSNDPTDLWASSRNFFIDNAADILVPTEGLGNISSKTLPRIGSAAKTSLRESVDLVHPVGKKLRQIEQEGVKQGLSKEAIKNRQMQEIGITSLQREGYFPGVSEVLSEYLVPYSYDNARKRLLDIPKKIIKGDTNTKRLADLDKVILDQGENTLSKPRYDAWRMYSGLPQKYGTFRMAETSPINHPSYTQNQLNNLEKFSLNEEKRLLSTLPSEYDYVRYVYNNEDLLDNVSYLKDQLKDINNLQKKGIDFPQSDFTTTNVMGGHNRRFFDNKMEYNDVWDLDLNGLKVDRYFGKPFMSHGQLEYSFEPAKKSINNLLRKAELLDNNINIFKGKSKYNFDDIKLNNYNNLIDTKVQKKKIGGKINNTDWEILPDNEWELLNEIPAYEQGGKVVSEIWQEVTGTPWSEAKKLGLTKGGYEENLAIRAELLKNPEKFKSLIKGHSKQPVQQQTNQPFSQQPKLTYKWSEQPINTPTLATVDTSTIPPTKTTLTKPLPNLPLITNPIDSPYFQSPIESTKVVPQMIKKSVEQPKKQSEDNLNFNKFALDVYEKASSKTKQIGESFEDYTGKIKEIAKTVQKEGLENAKEQLLNYMKKPESYGTSPQSYTPKKKPTVLKTSVPSTPIEEELDSYKETVNVDKNFTINTFSKKLNDKKLGVRNRMDESDIKGKPLFYTYAPFKPYKEHIGNSYGDIKINNKSDTTPVIVYEGNKIKAGKLGDYKNTNTLISPTLKINDVSELVIDNSNKYHEGLKQKIMKLKTSKGYKDLPVGIQDSKSNKFETWSGGHLLVENPKTNEVIVLHGRSDQLKEMFSKFLKQNNLKSANILETDHKAYSLIKTPKSGVMKGSYNRMLDNYNTASSGSGNFVYEI